MQLDLCDLKATEHQIANVRNFWAKATIAEPYPILTSVAIILLTVFVVSYLCGSALSHMNFTKNKFRPEPNQQHLCEQLRMQCTPEDDVITAIKSVFHLSHYFI